MNMLEKIVQDKDVEIRFDDALVDDNGNIANGKYQDGVITINPNSTRAGEFIAIHELTHAIGTEGMTNIIENYRKSNTEFDNSVKELLKNYKQTEITEEALADVSAQLFGNQEFINNLAQENPSVFKKIYNEIKYLWHQFRGYKNQNQFIEDLQYKWEQAYRNDNKLNDTTKYSVEYNGEGKPYIVIDNDILKNVPQKDWVKKVKEIFKTKFPDGIDMDFFNIGINSKSRSEFTNSKYSKWLRDNNKELYKTKFQMVDNIDEIAQNAYGVRNEELSHKRKDNLKSFNHSNIDVQIGDNTYNVEVVTGINTKNKELFYDIVNINRSNSNSYSANNAVTNKRNCFY